MLVTDRDVGGVIVTRCFETAWCSEEAMALSLETRWLIDRSVIWGSALCDDDGPSGLRGCVGFPAAVAGSTGRS